VLGNIGSCKRSILLFAWLPATSPTAKTSAHPDSHAGFAVGASLLLAGTPRSVLVIYTGLFLTGRRELFQGPRGLAILPHIVPAETCERHRLEQQRAGDRQRERARAGRTAAGLHGEQEVYLIQFTCAALTMAPTGSSTSAASPKWRRRSPAEALLEGVRFVAGHPLILPAISLDLFAVLFAARQPACRHRGEFCTPMLPALGWLRAVPSLARSRWPFS